MASVKRFSFVRFSLRSLFVVVTALCVFMGYELEWIRRRRAFLHEQLEKNEFLWRHTNVHRRAGDGQKHSPEWHYYSNKPAPHLLWLFNENALPDLNLILAESDSTPNRDATPDNHYALYTVSRKQVALRRAINLFPESEIHAYATDVNGVVHPAEVRD